MWGAALGRGGRVSRASWGAGSSTWKARGHWVSGMLPIDGCRQVHLGWGGLTSACVEVTFPSSEWCGCAGVGRGREAVGKAHWVVGTPPATAGVLSSLTSREAYSEASVPPGCVLEGGTPQLGSKGWVPGGHRGSGWSSGSDTGE